MTATQRYITLWRRPNDVLEWEFYISECLEEAQRVVAIVIEQGATQHSTYALGDKLPDLSRKF